MKVGFTGTRNGCSVAQRAALEELLQKFDITEGHHGDCIGADAEFHDILEWTQKCGRRLFIVVHPPEKDEHRAWKQGHIVRPAKSHFARNRDIVDSCDVIVACPPCATWQPNGGTFYTMDYAKKKQKPLYVIWPTGAILEIR